MKSLTDDLDLGGHHLRDWRYLEDIPQGGATTGQVLAWNGKSWAPASITDGSVAGAVTSVFDQTGDVLSGVEAAYDSELDVLSFSPRILLINANDVATTDFGGVGIQFAVTDAPMLSWGSINGQFHFSHPCNVARLVADVVVARNGPWVTLESPTSAEDDLYCKDVYIGLDLGDSDPSIFFGGTIDPLATWASIVYDSGGDFFDFSNPIRAYGAVEVDGSLATAPTGSDPVVYFGHAQVWEVGMSLGETLTYDVSETKFLFSKPVSASTVTATSGVVTDTISEKTSAAGVTVDSLLIKDGVPNVDDAYIVALDGGGATITTGAKGFYVCPFKLYVTGWTMVADQTSNVTIDVWKDTYANHPPVDADSWVTPSFSSATKGQGSSLTLTANKGDILRFNVDTCSAAQMITLALTGVRIG